MAGIAGMSLAASTLYESLDEDRQRLYELKKYFIEQVSQIDDVTVNGLPECASDTDDMELRYGAPHVVSVSVKDIRSEVMLHSLEESGIYISAGSACSSHKRVPSATLTSMGLDPKTIESTVRFSFSVFTRKEDLDLAIEKMKEFIPILRKYTRR